MKIFKTYFEPNDPASVMVLTDEWPDPVRVNIAGMLEAPTLSAIGRMAKATIDRRKREAAKAAMVGGAEAKIPAGRHEARNFC